MKKKILLLVVLGVLGATVLYGSMMGGVYHGRNYYANREESEANEDKLNSYVKTLKEKYGFNEEEKITPEKLTEIELEEIGELIMSINHPNEAEHEFMDKMMGGEGSETLKSMHKLMAINYLKGYGYGMMNGMHGSMMGGNMFSGRNYNTYQESALQILKKRLANGEISLEEYNQIREVLER